MNTYLALKSLHILGVVLFVGNIVVTAWWKVQADRTRHPAIVAFAQRQVTLTDWIFASGLLWVAILIPVQIKQARLARGFAANGPIPDEYWRLNRVWLWVGILATVLPAANLYFMVFKPV